MLKDGQCKYSFYYLMRLLDFSDHSRIWKGKYILHIFMQGVLTMISIKMYELFIERGEILSLGQHNIAFFHSFVQPGLWAWFLMKKCIYFSFELCQLNKNQFSL